MSFSVFCRNLFKDFDGLRAVDDVTFQMQDGEFLGLLGPNGAGKSTLMAILSCQLNPTRGEARIMGHDVVEERNEVKKIMGLCPQENVLYNDLTVRENLKFFCDLYSIPGDEANKRIGEILEFMNLVDKEKSFVKTLSGGMKRRLNIGAALVHRPRILMLDEPSVGLDPATRQDLWKAIRQIHEEGATIILTTHYMEEADTLCQKVAIMDSGRIVACDAPTALKKMVGVTSVIEMISSRMEPKAVEALRGLSDVKKLLLKEDGVRLVVEDVDSALPKAIRTATRKGLKPERINIVEPTLEDVFLHLTGKALTEETER
jgi:ABC-2 type transport system ATP-binding protein